MVFDIFLELNIMDGDFRATSDISVVAALRLRKGLCSGHEQGMVVAHRGLLPEGTTPQQHVCRLPQMNRGLWRLKFWHRISWAFEAPASNTDRVSLSVKWGVLGSDVMYYVGVCG